MSKFFVVLALAVATLLASPTPSEAAKLFFDQYLSTRTCYQRLYDVRHMRANPQQTLSKFHVVAPEADPLQQQRPNVYTVRFGYWIKNAGSTMGWPSADQRTLAKSVRLRPTAAVLR